MATTEQARVWCEYCNKPFESRLNKHSHTFFCKQLKKKPCGFCYHQAETTEALKQHYRDYHQIQFLMPFLLVWSFLKAVFGNNTILDVSRHLVSCTNSHVHTIHSHKLFSNTTNNRVILPSLWIKTWMTLLPK